MVRRPTFLIFTNAVILVVIFALLAQSLFVVQRLAQARELKGRVQVSRGEGGEFESLAKDATIALGDTIRTGSDGVAEFVFADRTRWRLGPNSQATLLQANANIQNRDQTSRLRLETGEMWLRNPQVQGVQREFFVETANALARTQGGVSRIETATAQTQIEVFKGVAQLKTDTRVVVLTAGEQGTAKPNQILVTKSPLARLSEITQSDTDFLRPTLEAALVPNPQAPKPFVVVRGQSEAGGVVRINGKKATTLGNGLFLRRYDLKDGLNTFQITASDANNEQSSTCKAVNFDAKTRKATHTTCD